MGNAHIRPTRDLISRFGLKDLKKGYLYLDFGHADSFHVYVNAGISW